jgi:hypothetical protein
VDPNLDKSGALSGEAREAIAKVIIETRLSASGTFLISDALDAKRLKYGIVDNAFKRKATFDKIFVYQIAEDEDSGDTYAGTSIYKPEWVKKRSLQEAPRAILVDAGLSAMDSLLSNGIRLGDTISFVRLAPYRIIVDWINGQEIPLMVLHSGDICGDEDLEERLRSGEVRYEPIENKDGSCSYVFVDENGKRWKPVEPWIPDDY